MPKAKVILVGVSEDITADETKMALAALYQKPESHFETHCQHLFELKQPFVLLKKVDTATAHKHVEKLTAIGIECDVQPLQASNGLSLVPVDEKAESSETICPACAQLTMNSEECDNCGVIMKKFADQKNIEEMLQNKIAAAERSEKRIKQAQLEAAERKKQEDKSKPKKKPAKLAPPVDEPDEGEVSKVTIVDKKSNRVVYMAVAGVLVATLGGGYVAYSMKQSSEQTEYDFAVAEETISSEVLAETSGGNAEVVEEVAPFVEESVFSQWRGRLAEVDRLKYQLDSLNSTVGMSSTMSGLVTGSEDPLVRIIGEQYNAQLLLQKQDSLGEEPIVYENTLDKNSLVLSNLLSGSDRLYAALNLGQTYQELGMMAKAEEVFQQAETYALDISTDGQGSEVVIAEVIAAEHQIKQGHVEMADSHYAAAIEAAGLIVPDLESDPDIREWAVAFVARSEAKLGSFASAHERVESINNDEIKELLMNDFSAIADNMDTDQSLEMDSIDSMDANERDFADDPDLMLLFENTRKMKENAKKISNLTDQ